MEKNRDGNVGGEIFGSVSLVRRGVAERGGFCGSRSAHFKGSHYPSDMTHRISKIRLSYCAS